MQNIDTAREIGALHIKDFVVKEEFEEQEILNLEVKKLELSEEELEIRKKLDLITNALGPLSYIKP